MNDEKIRVAKHRLEIHATEMSTVRMKWGEPHITLWVTGPKGGSKHMLRFDQTTANRLLRSFARACAALEEAATAAIVDDGFRRRSKAAKTRKCSTKKSSLCQ